MNKVCILYSGGADSRLMLEFAKDMNLEVFCILVDYGQKHIEELDFARETLTKNNIKFEEVRIDGFDIKSELINGEKICMKNVSRYYIPCRNMFLLSIACAFAESENISVIWHGADFSDRLNLFPDSYQEWFVKFNELLRITTSNKMRVEAPLLGMTKQVVLSLLENEPHTC